MGPNESADATQNKFSPEQKSGERMDVSEKKFQGSMAGMSKLEDLTGESLSDDRSREMQEANLNANNPSVNNFMENMPEDVKLEELKKDPYEMQKYTNESYEIWKKEKEKEGIAVTKENYINALKAGGLNVEENIPVLDARKMAMANNYKSGVLNDAQLENLVKTNQISEQDVQDIKTYAEYKKNMTEAPATPPAQPQNMPNQNVYVAQTPTNQQYASEQNINQVGGGQPQGFEGSGEYDPITGKELSKEEAAAYHQGVNINQFNTNQEMQNQWNKN